MALDMNAGNV
jgi:hypothetical protein